MFVSRPVHKSAHSRDLLAEGHTKWPAVTSTANEALEYFIKIKLFDHEIERVHVTFQKCTFMHTATIFKGVQAIISTRHQVSHSPGC
jgi:hypothetical protein